MNPLLRLYRRVPGNLKGMFWLSVSGAIFSVLNMMMRKMSLELDPYLTQFWRYLFGLIPLLPLLVRGGLGGLASGNYKLQIVRNLFHASGLVVWFTALPMLPLAEMTAIGFTGPLFIMIGAVMILGERVSVNRWLAVAVGFVGVLIVLRPGSSLGFWSLVCLCAAPLFAGSFLCAKVLSRYDRPTLVVAWQSVLTSLFSMPAAFLLTDWQWPSWYQFGYLALCGILGSAGHVAMVNAFKVAEMSAIQPIQFLNLMWATILGFTVFGDVPAIYTWVGGAVIFAAATYIARGEAKAAQARAVPAEVKAATVIGGE